MTGADVSLLLATLGGISMLASWIGRRVGDAPRDTWLMASIGVCLVAAAAALLLVVAGPGSDTPLRPLMP